MDIAEFGEIEYKNVLPALTSYKDYDQSEKDDEGYDDDEYDRDQNAFRSNKGRMLYCRKCEGHGIQILLKGHTALCPYVNCQCKSCDRLMRMRKSAFIRRYRTSLKDSDGTKLTITPVRLFENTNTRFAIARDDTSDSFNTGVTSSSSYNAQLASATSQVANNFSALSLGSITDFSSDLTNNDKRKCSTSRRDTVRPLDLSITRENTMAPILGTVAGPILNQRDGILGQSHHQQVSPVVASNNFQPKMMSEISPPQRELFSMLQSQNANQSGLEAFHHHQQQQHLAQLHAFQQQHQQRMGLPQSVQQQPPQNRVIPNGNISPPRVPLPLAMAPPQQMRPKRPGQSEAFQPNEPLNKRSTPGFLPNITPQMQQHLSAMSNPQQQIALLQQLQQQQQQQHQQSLPTSAAMQLSALQGHLPPSRLPFSGGPGFQQQPSYNPPNSVISTNETLQTHLRALQAPGMAGPPRPTFADPSSDFANLMAIMASNQNQNRLLEELKRTTGFDQNQFLNQLIRQEQLLQAQQKNQQQQHQQQNLMHMAIVQQQQHQQQQQQQHQQQQNNQRRQSLPAPVPNSIGMVSQAAAVGATQANGISFSNVCNAMPSPSKEASSTSSSVNSANNTSPNQNATYNREISPPPLGPAECRYQLFLNSIDLFNRGLVDDKNGLVDRFEIPENVAEAATLTYRAEIPMPIPTLSLDHPALRNYNQTVPTSSAAPIVDVEENAETSEQ